MNSNQSESNNNSNNNNNNNRHSDNLTIWSHITSTLLNTWFNDSNKHSELLIIDTRDTVEFFKLHIKNSINIQGSKIIYQQLKLDKISISELLLKYSNIDLISNNINELNIVVYDQKSEHTNQLDFDKSFSILLLKKLAQKYKSVSFLIGGFSNFNQMYPSLCESSNQLQLTNSPNSTINEKMNLNSPVLSITNSEQSSLIKDDRYFNTNNIFHLKPKQFKFNHSLSIYGVDLCSTSNSTISSTSTSSLLSDTKPQIIQQQNSVNYLTSPKDEKQPIREPTKILDFLYLGSQEDALSKETMELLNIVNVLNVSITCPKPDFISDAHFLRIPVNDGHAAKLLPFFEVAFKFIEKCRKANSKVLIHCLAGISRSPTLAIAYLMKHLNLKSDEAYKFVKERRQTISPNFNFLGQLYEYEKQQLLIQQNDKNFDLIKNSPDLKHTETMQTSNHLTFLKLEKNKFIENSTNSNNNNKNIIDISSQRKKYILNFSQFNASSNTLPSPSTALSNFNLNSPTTEQIPQMPIKPTVLKSFTCNSFNEITINQAMNKPNVVMRRPTNLLVSVAPKQDVPKPSNLNTLKRPSSILLNPSSNSNNHSVNTEQSNSLNRTMSNNSASSASSSCSSCSTCSNQSCSNCSLPCDKINNQINSNLSNNYNEQHYQYQKKIKLSPIQDKIAINIFNTAKEAEILSSPSLNSNPKQSFVFSNNNLVLSCNSQVTTNTTNLTSPLTPNNNQIYCFNNNSNTNNQNNTKDNNNLIRKKSLSVENLKDELSFKNEKDYEENDENLVFSNPNSNSNQNNINNSKSSSSSSSSNKNSLHGSIETMIEVL